MAPQPKKSKLTMSASGTRQPAASVKPSKKRQQEADDQGSDAHTDDEGDNQDPSSDDGGLSEMEDDEDDDDQDEFDVEGMNTDDELEERGPAKSKKTASSYFRTFFLASFLHPFFFLQDTSCGSIVLLFSCPAQSYGRVSTPDAVFSCPLFFFLLLLALSLSFSLAMKTRF